jgi:hypothetical protein
VSAGKSLSFVTLLDFIEQAEIADDADEEEQKQFDQICKCFVKAIVDVSLAGKFCQKKRKVILYFVSSFILTVSPGSSMSDDNLNHLYENSTVLNRYLKWIEDTNDESVTSDMQTCAALSLGNLARTGKHHMIFSISWRNVHQHVCSLCYFQMNIVSI